MRRLVCSIHSRNVPLLLTLCLPQIQAGAWCKAVDGKAYPTPPQAVGHAKEKVKGMTIQEAWKLYQRYLDGWKPISPNERKMVVAEVVAEDAQYTTPQHEGGGRETMIEDMAAFQVKFPGGHFDLEDVSAHHDAALLTWVLVQANGSILVKGHDQIRVSPEGKIIGLITFAPSVGEP